MSLVLYVSGHGLGHATREITMLQRLPANIPLVIKTASPEWHWKNELPGRDFVIVDATYDVGTIQRDSLASDATATLTAWLEQDERNKARFSLERDYLTQCGAKMIVSDVPSFPISVAADLGIPSVCIANFTWADIYSDLADEEPGLAVVADQLRSEYALTTLALEAGFPLPMNYFGVQESVGIISRTGVERRSELYSLLPESAQKRRLALVYAGNWGLPIPYERLAAFDDWHFLSLGDNAHRLPPNWTVLSRSAMVHPDLVASVDVVISKVGYGLVGECLAGGTPIVYCPRTGFAEYPVIDAYLSQRPHGMRISVEQFSSGDWGQTLAAVPPRGTIQKVDCPGAQRAADRIASLYRVL